MTTADGDGAGADIVTPRDGSRHVAEQGQQESAHLAPDGQVAIGSPEQTHVTEEVASEAPLRPRLEHVGTVVATLVILTPVPLTFIGIMLGHWMFSAPFSATSMIGFIALAGIIVRNSILLVDFIRNSGTGKVSVDVLIEAGAIRFKPILLTAIAAMIGAVVILADPIFQGLAISLLFGLLSSTLLTVLVIPAIYRVFRT